jgi:hypothetical protein
MSGGQERARQAREAYERAQQEAGRLAMEASRAATAAEQTRVAQNEQRLASTRVSTLERLKAQGYPGVQMVHMFAAVERGVFFKKTEMVAVDEPGWQVSASAHLNYSSHIYLLAEGSFVWEWEQTFEATGPVGMKSRISLNDLAVWPQTSVDEIITELDKLAASQ